MTCSRAALEEARLEQLSDQLLQSLQSDGAPDGTLFALVVGSWSCDFTGNTTATGGAWSRGWARLRPDSGVKSIL
jgi:hypothetical protein